MKIKISSLLFLSLLGNLVSSIGFGQSSHYLMAAMGDSITAATFAERSAKGGSSPTMQATASGNQTIPAWVPMVGKTDNRTTLSWASGLNIISHFLMLQDYLNTLGDTLSVLNVAVPGNKAAGMIPQASQVLSAMQTGQYAALKYLTFMIGANDACQGTDSDAMAESLRQTFQVLAQISQSERIRIIVSSIPKIPDLGRPEVLNTRTVGGLTCGQLQEGILKECNAMTVWTTQEEYDQRISIVQDKNQVLRNAVKEANDQYTNLDVVFSDQFFEAQLETAFLASDCFHPNANGQQEIATRLWKDQPWFR